MFDKNKNKLIKTQQALIESLKIKNTSLKKENEILKTKILARYNATEKDKVDFNNVIKELRQMKSEYESLIKELKDMKIQYSAYLIEITEIREKYKNLFK